jgi:spore maturation protein CgeB
MRIVIFAHSFISDWNHGNAHFLRGIVMELLRRGHAVRPFEQRNCWSMVNLINEYGEAPIRSFYEYYPDFPVIRYNSETLDLDRELENTDLVIVHEWNDSALVRRIGNHHVMNPGYTLLYHDTHHRALTEPSHIENCELANFDGVLAFGEVLKNVYQSKGWGKRVWTWHEAADTRVFLPHENIQRQGDIVWIGNWGDDERSGELREFFFEPVRELNLQCRIHGVRYPRQACELLNQYGITYAGWLPNYKVPQVFSQFDFTVHIPRQPYVTTLKGIPTIRPFEALACGIPLICAHWEDVEHLFSPGDDYLVARNGAEMKTHIHTLRNDKEAVRSLTRHGRQTILARHTCAHRVDELLRICRELYVRGSRVVENMKGTK